MEHQITLIIGANSEIAKAIANKVIADAHRTLIVVSRNTNFYQQAHFSKANIIPIKNYQEDEIRQTVKSIKTEAHLHKATISQVYICHGLLHSDSVKPEKRLEDFSADSYNEVITANTITPILWLKHLTPLLSSKDNCKITFFSARVGSISENKLGGWYSYRASKAGLNMLLKSAAVELSRRAKNIKLISFHPGTTNSPLSKPFQKNVPKGKLFTSDFVAAQLLNIVSDTVLDGEVSYLDWKGEVIGW